MNGPNDIFSDQGLAVTWWVVILLVFCAVLVFLPALVTLLNCWWRARFQDAAPPTQRFSKHCRREGCGCDNPASAHYCRRCGEALSPSTSAPAAAS